MDESLILRRQGGISKNFNLRLAGFGLPVVYADHIESPLARRWKAPQILSHHHRDLAPLMPVNRRFPGLHIARRPRFNFHEAKDIVWQEYTLLTVRFMRYLQHGNATDVTGSNSILYGL